MMMMVVDDDDDDGHLTCLVALIGFKPQPLAHRGWGSVTIARKGGDGDYEGADNDHYDRHDDDDGGDQVKTRCCFLPPGGRSSL